MRRNTEVPGDGLQALSADEPLPRPRSCGLFETWCFLLVAKASIPCQEIGSHIKKRTRVSIHVEINAFSRV